MPYPILLELIEQSFNQNLRQVVLSPGSRVAPLSLGFIRHPKIKCYTLSDERSAAYTALGMALEKLSQAYPEKNAQEIQLLALACTSGTAALNYAPAIAEAFFQEIPLIIFTADRPPEWIDQADNQAIRQRDLYAKNVKAFYQLDLQADYSDALWYNRRMVEEAFRVSRTAPYGPVHLNCPFREPFYPQAQEKFFFPSQVKVTQTLPTQAKIAQPEWNQLLDRWDAYERILIVGGQGPRNSPLIQALELLQNDYHVPVVADLPANLHELPHLIRHHDLFLEQLSEADALRLEPELLISYGGSVLSKGLKKFLRKANLREHWHIQESDRFADTFQNISHLIPMRPESFFNDLFNDLDFKNTLSGGEEEDQDYLLEWLKWEQKTKKFIYHSNFRKDKLSEFECVGAVLEALPPKCSLHLGNSMPVRYANAWGIPPHLSERTQQVSLKVFSNRGTSGIDGSLSTAVGVAMNDPEVIQVLIIGDLSFFYDRNGLWNTALPSNLRIILLNNQGGNIFRMIPGAGEMPELSQYFETEQLLQAENTARDFNLMYQKVKTRTELELALEHFFEKGPQSKLMEISSSKEDNAEQWLGLKSLLSAHLSS